MLQASFVGWLYSMYNSLKGIKALMVGGLTNMKKGSLDFGMSPEEVILEHVANLNIPVAFNLPFGHDENNLALPMGVNYKIKVSKESVLMEVQMFKEQV